jgi:hypothetical protein
MKIPISLSANRSLTNTALLWVQGWAHLLEALVMILSLGLLIPGFVITVAKWRTSIFIRHLKAKAGSQV